MLCRNGKYFSGELTRRHILIQLCHNGRSLQALIRVTLAVEFQLRSNLYVFLQKGDCSLFSVKKQETICLLSLDNIIKEDNA